MEKIFKFLIIIFLLVANMYCTNNKNLPISSNECFQIKKSKIDKYKKDALLGSEEAAFKLFEFYEFYKNDSEKSFYWVRIAAENGHAISQHYYSYFLLKKGTKEFRLRAIYWAKKSYENGNKDALDLLNEIN